MLNYLYPMPMSTVLRSYLGGYDFFIRYNILWRSCIRMLLVGRDRSYRW